MLKKSVNGNRLKPCFRQDNPAENVMGAEETYPQKKLLSTPMVPDQNLEDLVKPRYWLTDDVINAAQKKKPATDLLKCHGLQDTFLSLYSQFK